MLPGAACNGLIIERVTFSAAAQVTWLQGLTISWMLVECSVSLAAAWRSHSAALLAFGSESLVELLSASVVLLQFSPRIELNQKGAARLSAVLLFLLAGVVTLTSAFAVAGGSRADSSFSGMIVTVGALVMMPALAFLKRSKARELNNRALAADAVQSATCALSSGRDTLQSDTKRRVPLGVD